MMERKISGHILTGKKKIPEVKYFRDINTFQKISSEKIISLWTEINVWETVEAHKIRLCGYVCCILATNPHHPKTTEHFSSQPGIRNGIWLLFMYYRLNNLTVSNYFQFFYSYWD